MPKSRLIRLFHSDKKCVRSRVWRCRIPQARVPQAGRRIGRFRRQNPFAGIPKCQRGGVRAFTPNSPTKAIGRRLRAVRLSLFSLLVNLLPPIRSCAALCVPYTRGNIFRIDNRKVLHAESLGNVQFLAHFDSGIASR